MQPRAKLVSAATAAQIFDSGRLFAIATGHAQKLLVTNLVTKKFFAAGG